MWCCWYRYVRRISLCTIYNECLVGEKRMEKRKNVYRNMQSLNDYRARCEAEHVTNEVVRDVYEA